MQSAEWQRPVRRRSGFRREGLEVSRFAPPNLMASVMPTSIPAGRRDFADVAERDRTAHLLRRLAARGPKQRSGDVFCPSVF